MAFKDRFPLEIEFDVDRDRLLRYLLSQARASCAAVSLPVGLLLALAFFNSHMVANPGGDIWFRLRWSTAYLLMGILASAALASVFYFAYFRRSARLRASNLRLMVEGPYLRLVTGGFVMMDERFHFRDVSSYGTIQGPYLRRHRLKSLCFRIHGRATALPQTVTGLVDVDSVRDVLCEIDASRELQPSNPDTTS